MKLLKYLPLAVLLMSAVTAYAQDRTTKPTAKQLAQQQLTIEPGIGINPMPISDMLVSNVVQYNIKKRLSVVSYSSYTFNNAFKRTFNNIHTNYNYSLSQKLGVGTSVYSKHMSHTFALLAGVKYTAFKETLDNPEFEKVSASVSSFSPDLGLMYNLKLGTKKYFFSYRMYLPLNPYPFKTRDINAIDGNLAYISLELGLGIRLGMPSGVK